MNKCIKGIGTDIIEIERIKNSIEKYQDHFLNKLFTIKEQEYCSQFKNSHIHYAGRFAAKEAVAKALGLGFGKDLSFLDIEIINNERGKPEVQFSNNSPSGKIFLSISHTKELASSTAIWHS